MSDWTWPEHLVERIGHQDFVLVIGAGVSANAKNSRGDSPPSWIKLLGDLNRKIINDSHVRGQIDKLIELRQLINAAELLKLKAGEVGKSTDLLNALQRAVDGSTRDKFAPGLLHDILLRFEPNIVVTTNYDRLWERASGNGYALHAFDSSSLGRSLRAGEPLLVKMHGGVDNINDIILSRSDFARVRQVGAHVFDVLRSLFLTRTALFVGYGFADPDLQLLLEDSIGPQGGPPSHYWLTGDDLPDHMRVTMTGGYGVQPLFYPAGDYSKMADRLSELADLCDGMMVRRVGT